VVEVTGSHPGKYSADRRGNAAARDARARSIKGDGVAIQKKLQAAGLDQTHPPLIVRSPDHGTRDLRAPMQTSQMNERAVYDLDSVKTVAFGTARKTIIERAERAIDLIRNGHPHPQSESS
jgi:hypothetical protein